jgi:hypothetical protein
VTPWVLDWLHAFALTLLVEEAVAIAVLFGFDAARRPTGTGPLARRLAAVALVNLATHPLVWFLIPGLRLRYGIRVGASELWALSAETLGYLTIWPTLRLERAFLLSLLANGASFGLGLLV